MKAKYKFVKSLFRLILSQRLSPRISWISEFAKAAMEAVGLQAGPPRPPYTRLVPELIADLQTLLREAGVPTV